MQTIFVTLLALLIPAMAALGHDYYIYISADPTLETNFYFAQIGWIWQTYHESSLTYIEGKIPENIWQILIVPVLKAPATIALATPAIVVFIIMLTMKAFGLGAYEGEGFIKGRPTKFKKENAGSHKSSRGNKNTFAAPKAIQKKGPIKYKRK